MKRLWLLGLVLVFVLTACGGQSPQPELPEEAPQQQAGEEQDQAKDPADQAGEQTQLPGDGREQEEEQTQEEKVEEEEEEDEVIAPPQQPDNGQLYFLRVNCQTNTITVYTKDEAGEYTVPYRAMICSTGANGGTPLGTYRLSGNRWEWLSLVGGVQGRYNTQIFGDYLFHSVPYLERYNNGSLQPGEFDKLGTACSHGCIRLQICDAMWIYYNLWDIGGVEIYNSPDPGPLGTPTAPKIDQSEFPGWDPTDPDEENPWLKVETDPEGGATDPEGGETDPEGGETDPEGGETDPEGGVTDPEGGETDPEGGETDPEGGETDPEGGETDHEGGETDPEGGETDPEGGEIDPEGGETDPEGGETDPEGGETDPEGETTGSEENREEAPAT